MWAGAGKIKFGIYACSPEAVSYTHLKKIPVLLTVYVENRKEPYGIKSVYWNRYCSGVSWTVTFHVYRFDFIIGGMKDGIDVYKRQPEY